MLLSFDRLMLSVSQALDYVERDLLGVGSNHAKRVACLCARMGQAAGMEARSVADLAACAVLHDNALTEYIQSEYLSGGSVPAGISKSGLGIHCTLGERNVAGFPFFTDMKNAILYHHENADGSGPFGRTGDATPLAARIIHLTDQVDARFGLGIPERWKQAAVSAFLDDGQDRCFCREEVRLLRSVLDHEGLDGLADGQIEASLRRHVPHTVGDYSPQQIIGFSGVFACITDYKSTFTSLHSKGIAHKAYLMGSAYGYDEEHCAKLFLAGAFHDVGKLAISTDILEKPDKLTDREYAQMKRHALITHQILSGVEGLEEVCRWASHHHEKLDGSGYPFGLTGDSLGREERLMACLDIYQALREDRPYKKGKPHQAAIDLLRDMARQGLVDAEITEAIHQIMREQES